MTVPTTENKNNDTWSLWEVIQIVGGTILVWLGIFGCIYASQAYELGPEGFVIGTIILMFLMIPFAMCWIDIFIVNVLRKSYDYVQKFETLAFPLSFAAGLTAVMAGLYFGTL